ncbi:MAG: TonB-dependent receptor [Bacillota bacterium]
MKRCASCLSSSSSTLSVPPSGSLNLILNSFYLSAFFSLCNFCFCFLLLVTAFTSRCCSQPSETGILKGFVSDKKTTQKLQNASLIIINTDKGTATNANGYFEIKLPEGDYLVEARMLGYLTLKKQCRILPGEKTSLFFELEPTILSTNEVSVTGRINDNKILSRSYELLPGDLKEIPQFGEADPFRALQALPGVTSINDIGNQLFLRGGNFDETLIALDGVPLYNPYHLGGIFSSINSDIIGKERIYLSNYPQSIGGYLSGALELYSKTGSPEAIRTSASLGLISSKGLIEGPLWKGNFVASARRTYLDALNLFFSDNLFPYYFYDLFGKYTLPFDDKNILSISSFYSEDVLKEDFKDKNNKPVAPHWGNFLLNSSWTHLFNASSEFNLQAYLSRSFMKSDEISDGTYFDNSIWDATLKAQYDFILFNDIIRLGAEYKHIGLDYSWFDNYSALRDYVNPPEEVFFDYAPNPYSYADHADILNSFITGQIKLSERLMIKLGLRGSYFTDIKYFIPCPSASIDYTPFSNTLITFSFGRYYQYLYTLKEKRPESIYTPFSVYFLSENNQSTALSYHYSLSLNIRNILWDIDLDAEAYYKDRKNLASSYSEHPRYRFENGYAAGIDFMLKKTRGTITGWAGYSIGKSLKRNELYSYYSNCDRRHTVKILLGYQLSENWKLNAFWTYAAGTPYTGIGGKYLGGIDLRDSRSPYFFPFATWRLVDAAKNNQRLRDHHRLDLGITGSFIWGSFLLSPYLQILNVYCSSNQIILNNNLEDSADESLKFQNSFIIPTLGVNIEF